MMETALGIFQSISILAGIWAVIYGINAWRREYVGKRRIELAEETLAKFYEVKDAIRYMRSPASYASEQEDIERTEHESDEEFYARRTISVVFHRYGQKSELFNSLMASRYRFMAVIGIPEAEPFEEVRKVVNSITRAAHMLAMIWPEKMHQSGRQAEEWRKRVQKQEDVFWERSEDDEINTKVVNLVNEMEATCKKVIEGQTNRKWWQFWK